MSDVIYLIFLSISFLKVMKKLICFLHVQSVFSLPDYRNINFTIYEIIKTDFANYLRHLNMLSILFPYLKSLSTN